jgi:two-component system phosphate regulon response regulator PhoB
MTRILVVEDEPAIAELAAINLRHAGYEVSIAPDADAAQAAVDRVLPVELAFHWRVHGVASRAPSRCRSSC